MFVFFQAEDGIRDLVRSRGLGDVYKRQIEHPDNSYTALMDMLTHVEGLLQKLELPYRILRSVSYTHLTLPTSDLV